MASGFASGLCLGLTLELDLAFGLRALVLLRTGETMARCAVMSGGLILIRLAKSIIDRLLQTYVCFMHVIFSFVLDM